MNAQLLRSLPRIDAITGHPALSSYNVTEKNLLLESARSVIESLRAGILDGSITSEDEVSMDAVIGKTIMKIAESKKYHLKRVINATGVVLHTNLGRARLSDDAFRHIIDISCGYSNLEYDLATGKRGSRHDHIDGLLSELLQVI